jgi:hypothetical protein
MGKQQKVYTREFKVEAVQFADQGEQACPGSGHQTARGGRKSVG